MLSVHSLRNSPLLSSDSAAMVQACLCLVFINAAELDLENNKKKRRPSKKFHIGYAIFCPTPKNPNPNSRLASFLSNHGIQVIQNDRVSPPENAKFEALEIIININARRTSIHCDHLNLEFLCRVFKNISRIDGNLSCYDVKDAMIDDRDLDLIETLFVSRANMPFRGSRTEWLLHFAVERGHRNLFKLLRKCGADVNRVKGDGATPLHTVIDGILHNIKHRVWFAKKLLKAGANVNARTREGRLTPLLGALDTASNYAYFKTCIRIIRLLLKNGANVNARVQVFGTALHIAARLHHEHMESTVKLLFAHGANLHIPGPEGATTLLSFYESPHILRLLIEKGAAAAVDVQTTDGRTVLLETVQYGCFESAKYILSLQPSVSVRGNRQAFYAALSRDHEEDSELAYQMIEQGFTVSSDASDDPAVVFGAIKKGLVEIVQNLLDNGVAVNQWNISSPSVDKGWGMTPLHYAIQSKRANIVALLLERGADVNGREKWQCRTPLVSAVQNKCLEIVKMIMEANAADRADPNLLFIAVRTRNPSLQVLEFLLQEGFDPNFEDERKRSCFSFLISQSLEIIDLLIKYGGQCSYNHINDYLDSWSHSRKMLQACLDHCPVDVSASGLYICNEETARHLLKLKVLVPEINIFQPPRGHSITEGLNGFKDQCEEEAKKLTENIAESHVTYRDILTSTADRASCYARNDCIAEAMQPSSIENRFPIYASILNRKFRTAVLRKTLEAEAVPVIKRLVAKCCCRLPDVILKALTRYLSNRDLIILQKCLPAEESP